MLLENNRIRFQGTRFHIYLFSFSVVVDLLSLRFQNYFRDPWNIFDFVTVIGSITDVIVSELSVTNDDISISPSRVIYVYLFEGNFKNDEKRSCRTILLPLQSASKSEKGVNISLKAFESL
jgi:hypothetical protein